MLDALDNQQQYRGGAMQERVRIEEGAKPVQNNIDEETLAMGFAVALSESVYEEVGRDPEALRRVMKRLSFILQAFLGSCAAAGADADHMVDIIAGVYSWV